MRAWKRLVRVGGELIGTKTWIVYGREAATGQPLSMFFAGTAENKSYITNLVFRDSATEVYNGCKPFWSLLTQLDANKCKCSLAVIEAHTILKALLKREQDLFVPVWLDSYVETPLEARNRSSVSSIKTIEKNRLTYSTTKSADAIRDFYASMYLPTIQSRHGDSALIAPFEDVEKALDAGHCELLQISKDGQAIGGVLILTDHSPPRLWLCGVRDAKPDHWKAGALAGVYLFSSQHLAKSGATTMALGGTRAFLSDGILFYKSKWGAMFKPRGVRGFLIRPLQLNAGSKGFLLNSPMLDWTGGVLTRVAFADAEVMTEGELRKLKCALPEVPDSNECRVLYPNETSGSFEPVKVLPTRKQRGRS